MTVTERASENQNGLVSMSGGCSCGMLKRTRTGQKLQRKAAWEISQLYEVL